MPTSKWYYRYLNTAHQFGALIINQFIKLKWYSTGPLKPWNRHHQYSIYYQVVTKFGMALFKSEESKVGWSFQYLPSPFPVITTRSHHPIKLQQLYTRRGIYHYSFLPRTIPDWNNLCIDNINELDLIQFKDFVIKLWTDFYVYILACYPL